MARIVLVYTGGGFFSTIILCIFIRMTFFPKGSINCLVFLLYW